MSWDSEDDPFWQHVILLAGQQVGLAGAATPLPLDESMSAQLVDPMGGPVWDMSLAPPIDGAYGSLLVRGGTNYDRFQFAASPDFNLGAADFTCEGWLYCTSFSPALGTVFVRRSINATRWVAVAQHNSSSALRWWASSNGSSWSIGSGIDIGTLTLNTWHHWAMVRHGNIFAGYLDGVRGTEVAVVAGTSVVGTETDDVTWGAEQSLNSWGFIGNLFGLRVTKGVARYTNNFAPPQAVFPARGYASNRCVWARATQAPPAGQAAQVIRSGMVW
jgi:hypothetical protein